MNQDRRTTQRPLFTPHLTKLFCLVAISALLNACGLIQSDVIPHTGPQSAQHSSEPTSKSAQSSAPIKISDIEIVWEVDTDNADYYWIRYGFNPDNIEYTLKLDPSELKREQDPELGELYIFLLKDIPTSTAVYVQVASELDGVVSPFSRVFEVPPANQPVESY